MFVAVHGFVVSEIAVSEIAVVGDTVAVMDALRGSMVIDAGTALGMYFLFWRRMLGCLVVMDGVVAWW